MKFNELPKEVQDRLLSELAAKANTCHNTAFEIKIYSRNGKRYLYARRCVGDSVNKYGHSWRLGGPHCWEIQYGPVQFESYRDQLGQKDWRLTESTLFTSIKPGIHDGEEVFFVPKTLKSKKDVIDLISDLGKFDTSLLKRKK